MKQYLPLLIKSIKFLFLLLLLSDTLIYAQILIKEKVEINPSKLPTNSNSVNLTNESFSLTCEIDWDKPLRNATVKLINFSGTQTGGDWTSGGTNSVDATLDNINWVIFQVKVNLDEYEMAKVNYRIYFNGTLSESGNFELVGKLSSIPYRNIYYYPPLRTGFDLTADVDGSCYEKIGYVNPQSFYNANQQVQFNIDTDPFSFSFIEGGDKFSFYDYQNNNLGKSFSKLYREYIAVTVVPDNPQDLKEGMNAKVEVIVNGLIKQATLTFPPLGRWKINTNVAGSELTFNSTETIFIDLAEIGDDCGIDPPEDYKFTASITAGSQYCNLVDPVTGEKGKSISNLSRNGSNAELEIIADGDIAQEEDYIKVVIGSDIEGVADRVIFFDILPPKIIAETDPAEISPGEFSNLLIQRRNDDGTLSPFPAEQEFTVQITKGEEYGLLYSQNLDQTSSSFENITGNFEFRANEEIDKDTAEIEIKVSTIIDDVNTASAEVNTELTEQMKNALNEASKDLAKDSGNINIEAMPTFIAPPSDGGEEVFAVAKLKIVKKENLLHHFEVSIIPDTLSSKDTLAFAEKATLIVQAKDSSNNNIELDENKLLDFSILTNTIYLTFIDAAGNIIEATSNSLLGITYKDANEGKIKIAAYEENPDSVVVCSLRVVLQEDESINGENNAVVLEQTLKIIMDGQFVVQPIITTQRNDAVSTAYLNNITDNNRKEFRVKFTRGGKVLGGHKFILKTNYIDGTGGHDHLTPRRPTESNDANIAERMKRQNYGSFYSFNGDSTNSAIQEITVEEPLSRFNYIASIWGDEMKIYLSSLQHPLLKDSVQITERIPDLVELPNNNNLYVKIGGTNNHNGPPTHIIDHNHYGTQGTVNHIENIARDFHRKFPNENLLNINDISLSNGGKFDINGSWSGSHKTHREGIAADIRSSLYEGDRYIDNNRNGNYDQGTDQLIDRNNNGTYESSILEGFKQICRRRGIRNKLEFPANTGGGSEHWHVNF